MYFIHCTKLITFQYLQTSRRIFIQQDENWNKELVKETWSC